MSKNLYLACAMLAAGMTTNAQNITFQQRVVGYSAYSTIPAEVTTDGNKYFFTYEDFYDESTTEVSIYNDELEVVKKFSIPITNPERYYSSFESISGVYDAIGYTFSQTLFNDDENYEYVRIDYVEHSNDGLGFSVLSSNGDIVCTVVFEDTIGTIEDVWLFDLNGKKYLAIGSYDDAYGYTYFFKIDKGSSSIKQVGSPLKMTVRPTITRRSEPVTVQLDDDAVGIRTVTVVDTSGRTVYRKDIAANQRAVSIDTSRLSPGLNVVSVSNEKGTKESCKIYVK